MDLSLVVIATGSSLIVICILICILCYFADLLKGLRARLDVLIRLKEWELEVKYGEEFRPRE